MMSDETSLRGASVILRKPRLEDIPNRLQLGQVPEIVHMFGGDPNRLGPMTETMARAWVERLIDHPNAWIVEYDGRLIGEIRLDSLDEHDRKARLSIGLLDPDELGKGLGRDAIRALLNHAFKDLNLHRVDLRVLAYNTRAIRCYLACGFREEGRERQSARVAGEWHDDVIMGVLAHEVRPTRR